jgi:hypothetical protein
MRSKQNRTHRLRRRLAILLVSGAALFAPAAFAAPVDWHDLAANPQNYLGKEIEIAGYCAQGGAKGDVLGYECATEGTVYIDARMVEPDDAKQKVDANCGGMDVIERSSFCRVTIRLTPHSYTSSSTIEEGKTVTVFNADKAELSF